MSRLHPITLALCLTACDGGDTPAKNDPKTDAAADAKADAATPAPAVSTTSDSPATPPTLAGPIVVPDAVPKGASAVAVARVPESLLRTLADADPMGFASEDFEALQTEMDTFLRSRLGITIASAKTVAAFQHGKEFGLVLDGIDGSIKGTKSGTHGGVDIYTLASNDTLRAASTDSMLLVGTEALVKASIDAHADPSKSSKDDAVTALIAKHSDGAAVTVAVDIDAADPSAVFKRALPSSMKLRRGVASFGPKGLSVVVEGEKETLDQLAGLAKAGLDSVLGEARRAKEDAMKSRHDAEAAVAGAFTIFGVHQLEHATKHLLPKVDGEQLTLFVPFSAGDPALLAAVAGIGAAIAVPAFSKYVRRSKTSEARVQLAKMFDSTASYFNEEHVSRGATSLVGGAAPPSGAPHQCPNNGKLEGESGITPPLSVDCSKGPGGRCVPTAGGGGPGYYDIALWNDNVVWNQMNMVMEQAHYFHYNFKWGNDDKGYGTCQFTAQAFADLDGDGVFSTYERSGAADMHGVNASIGLYIDQEVE